MGWKKILAGCVPFAVVLVMWVFRASIKGLFTRSPTDSVAHAARLVWFLAVLRAFICPRARMPELTIYRQTDLESAPSSTLARQQAADVTPAPATTTEDAHFLSPIFRQFSRHWKKGTSSDAKKTVPDPHSRKLEEGHEEAAGSTTDSAPLSFSSACSHGTSGSAKPPADATTPDSTQSYRVDHLPIRELELIYGASTSKFSYPIRVINLSPGAFLGRDAADVVPASQAATDNGYESQVGQNTWWKRLQVVLGSLGLGS